MIPMDVDFRSAQRAIPWQGRPRREPPVSDKHNTLATQAPAVLKAIDERGWPEPTAVQAQACPALLAGADARAPAVIAPRRDIAEHNAAALEREGYSALEAVFAGLRPSKK